MYQVTVHHHDKDIVRGDLEDKFELIRQEKFITRTKAKEWIEAQLNKRAYVKKSVDWHKGDKPSYAICWTGMTWQHENSGEMMEEYYQYTLKKIELR